MALTIAPHSPHAGAGTVGPRRSILTKVTFDSSYNTGGEAFDPAQFGIQGKPAAVFVAVRPGASTTFIVQYDRTNKKLMVFQQTDPGSAGGADVPFKEVASTTDLHTLVCDVLIIESGSGT